MRIQSREQIEDAQIADRISEHWRALLTAACQLVGRAPDTLVASARVSQRGCGARDEAAAVRDLAESLADEFGLVVRVTSVGPRVTVRFQRRAAA